MTLEVTAGLVVRGRITDAHTGAPIAGAEVVSGKGAWKRARSDGDGRYRLEGVEPVRPETLFVRAEGHAGAQLALDPARADAMDVALEPGRAAFGRVVDERGAPVEQGQVVAWTSPYFEGGGARDELAKPLEEEGGFRVTGSTRRSPTASSFARPVTRPGTSRWRAAPPTLDATVTGTVVEGDGAPVPLAYVFRARGERGPGGGVLCDDAGRFGLAVPGGASLELVARRTRHLSAGDEAMTVTEFQIGRDVAPAELGEARRAGVRPGETGVELRMRP